MKNSITFNNGFVTAMTLFLEHKMWTELLPRDKNGKVYLDLRLYGATDHLYNMEIPEILSKKLQKRIFIWRDKCFKNRMNNFKNTLVTDELFKEAEDILAKVDEEIFKIKKVIMRYR